MTSNDSQHQTAVEDGNYDVASKQGGYYTFIESAGGVFQHFYNKKGEPTGVRQLCGPLRVVALARDINNDDWATVVEYHDRDDNVHRCFIPYEQFHRHEFLSALYRGGLYITAGRKIPELLAEYLIKQFPKERARLTDTIGWHGRCFVRPDQTMGSSEEPVIYRPAGTVPEGFTSNGTLEEWKSNNAALCIGNTRLTLAVSIAFTAPLLSFAGVESGGVHYQGPSSIGKTTALMVGGSACGSPEYMRSWSTTINGLEGVAKVHCDCLLVLDELSKVQPSAAGQAAFLLANETGKQRADKTGEIRPAARWKLMFISSGEVGLAQHMAEDNKTTTAGQEVRLAEIPADTGSGFGLFEDLHGFDEPSKFADHSQRLCKEYHGTAVPQFILELTKIYDEVPGKLEPLMDRFLQTALPADAAGQVVRVAKRFALIAAAGELATEFQITGWEPGWSSTAAKKCFFAWLEHRGSAGQLEETKILEHVRHWFQHNCYKFIDWAEFEDTTRFSQVLGLRKRYANWPEPEYFVFKEIFRQDICKGFDYKAVEKVLIKHDLLRNSKDGPLIPTRLPESEKLLRLYQFSGSIFSELIDPPTLEDPIEEAQSE